MAPKSLRAHKCGVFVKQHKVQRRKRAWKHRETEAKRKKKSLECNLEDTKVEELSDIYVHMLITRNSIFIVLNFLMG